MAGVIKDSAWVRQAFVVPSNKLDIVDQQNRFFSTAALKFTDTTPGGNFAINPPPQFTRSADIKATSLSGASKGMGVYYSEAIDDNAQLIHLRFGVPQFNSLTTFFTGFYNGDAGRLARTGRASSIFYTLGRAAAFVVTIRVWPLILVQYAGNAVRFFLNKPASKFYYLKPTMHTYWSAVNTMVNHIAVNKGIVHMTKEGSDNSSNDEVNYELGLGSELSLRKKLHASLPDIFDEYGGIDVFSLANKAQRLAQKQKKRLEALLENDPNTDVFSALRKFYNGDKVNDDSKLSFKDYRERWLKNELAMPKTDSGTQSAEILPEYTEAGEKKDDGWKEYMDAALNDGSEFVTFRVQHTGTVSESFSSSTRQSDIASKINGMSQQSRSTDFSMAGGNIAPVIGEAVTAVKDFLAGAAEQLNIQGLASLAGSALVDIPEHWDASTASLPKSTYTIYLASPYGNPISRLINIDIPLAMLLAGALPLSTGKQSYTSPLLCEIYDRGRCQTRLGIIDSLSITRGSGNLGWTNDGQVLGVEVTFSVKDLSSIMHMPISEGFSFNPATGIFDEDTVFSDYLAVLAGMSLSSQIYQWPKFKRNLLNKLNDFRTWASISNLSTFLVSGDSIFSTPGRALSALYKGTAR